VGAIQNHCLGQSAAKGMSKRRSAWKRTAEGKTVRCKTLPEHFTGRGVELLESPALRVLSRAAHLALLRIELELRHNGGFNNGKLIVTTEQFIEYGISENSVAPALRELEALGLIRITQRGRGGNAEYRRPHHFRLNYLCGEQEAQEAPLDHLWKRVQTLEEAALIAQAARNAKDPHKVADGRRQSSQKHCPPPKTGVKPPQKMGAKTAIFPPPKTGVLSILGVGGWVLLQNLRAPPPPPRAWRHPANAPPPTIALP
jgi:hypothetical protein